MARETINTGETFRVRDPKINSNFTELYVLAGQSGITIDSRFIFANTTERNTYFATNPNELVEGVSIAVGTEDIDTYLLQKWILNDPDRWEDMLIAILINGLFYPKSKDNSTESHIPIKTKGALENSSLTQDLDGNIVAATKIIAEAGIDTTPNTIEFGHGMDLSTSGAQQINKSKVTGKMYQIPYQEFDKTGTKKLINKSFGSEIIGEERQLISNTPLISGSSFIFTAPKDEIINAIHLKTNGDLTNFRYQVLSVGTGEVIDSYPNKFKYQKNIGVNLVGAGDHKIDLYYVGDSTPMRFLSGNQIQVTFKWDNENAVLGNSSGEPYHLYDLHEFSDEYLATESHVSDEIDKLKNPTWVIAHSVNTDITYGGFKTTGIIRERTLSTGIDRYFQSLDALPIPTDTGWTDWQNRDTLTYA